MRYAPIGLLFLSAGVSAQTTNCYSPTPSMLTCQVQPSFQQPGPDYSILSKSVPRPAIPSPDAIERMEASRMVSAGDCAGAEKYALGKGNFVLAKQIKDYCAK